MDRIAAHALIRFGLGASQEDDPGADPRQTLKAQLRGPDPGLASGAFATLPTGLQGEDENRATAQAVRALLKAGLPVQGRLKAKPYYMQDVEAQMGFAATTAAGFRERLVWFWTNHFSVSVSQGHTGPLIGPFIREAIRPHVNGNFTDMVLAAERHPAMLHYLMNADSVGPDSPVGRKSGRGTNENLGRECMELHTVGLRAGYTQADVTAMAKILTGWSTGDSTSGGDSTGYKYRPALHEPGPQTLMGRTFDGGERAGIDALTFLSRHPATYRHLATKLVTHFVADRPPPPAVRKIAAVLQETGGDLAAAAAALVDLPEAWTALNKLKTPVEFLISALRAAPPPAAAPVKIAGAAAQLGQPVWNAPLPNGWPDQAANWDGSDAVIARIDWAYTYAARFDAGAAGQQPADMAAAALGPLLSPATATAIGQAGSRREALTMLFASPEFQRR